MIDNLGEILRNNAYKLPTEIAIVYQGERISFGQYFRRAQKLASALHSSGVRRQDRIGVLSQNSAHYLEVLGAAELAGFAVATVNFRLAAPEIAYILGDCAPRTLIFESQYAEAIGALRDSLGSVSDFICIGAAPSWARAYEEVVDSGSEEGAPTRAHPDDLMHLIYTSGTTGRPKGVMRTHRAELGMAEYMTSQLAVLRGDNVPIMMPRFHGDRRWLPVGLH